MDDNGVISLCIIDDIKSVVAGLTCMNWAEQGIRVAGTAANGEDGLDMISSSARILSLRIYGCREWMDSPCCGPCWSATGTVR